MGWRGRGPSCVPLPLHPQPSPCWPAVGTAVGSTQENQHPLNRPLPRPLTCCPPTALSLLPPIHSTTSGPSCERQKAGAPWGGVPIREEVKLASFPSPLSPLPIPTLSPRAVPHPPPPCCSPGAPGWERGRNLNQWKWGWGWRETEGTAGRGFPGSLNPVAHWSSALGWAGLGCGAFSGGLLALPGPPGRQREKQKPGTDTVGAPALPSPCPCPMLAATGVHRISHEMGLGLGGTDLSKCPEGF